MGVEDKLMKSKIKKKNRVNKLTEYLCGKSLAGVLLTLKQICIHTEYFQQIYISYSMVLHIIRADILRVA